MEADFWHHKWQRGEIAFHQSQANPMLVAHFEQLNLAAGSRVFVPLCGKTLDISWLLQRGYRVAGAELSELAVKELFESLGVLPSICQVGALQLYSAEHMDIYVGDIFALSAAILGEVNAIYDRAALVALPAGMRKPYAAHLMRITNNAPQLLIAYEYDQSLVDGPPFSVSGQEIARLYGETYELTALQTCDVAGGIKGRATATETAWLLHAHT